MLPHPCLSLSPHPHETRFETTLLYLKMATGRSELFWKELRSEEKRGRKHDVMNCQLIHQMDPSWYCHNFSTSREEEGRGNHLHTKVIITI